MRFIAFFIFIFTPLVAMGDALLWSQEFNNPKGTLLDGSYWLADKGDGCEVGNCGWGNGERQYYLPDAASMDGKGNLVLTASRQQSGDCYYGKCEWTSARYHTLGKVAFRYGLIEARIKASAGEGAWPAFWLLGANYSSIGWPGCGELDIGEWIGSRPRTVLGTAHWRGDSGASLSKGGEVVYPSSLTSGFHTYGLRWLPEKIEWLLDGQVYHTLKKNELNQQGWPFDSQMFLLINLAMGGWSLSGPVSPSLEASTFTIDWIRYSKANGYGEVAFD